MSAGSDPEVLTVKELGKLLRVGRNQAYALVRSGAITSCRVGGSIRIPRPALESFLRGAARPYTAEEPA